MKISELIQALQATQAKHGDLPVTMLDEDAGPYGVYMLIIDSAPEKRLLLTDASHVRIEATAPWHGLVTQWMA